MGGDPAGRYLLLTAVGPDQAVGMMTGLTVAVGKISALPGVLRRAA